ncbi:MAG: MBL fold metallo-hydrolase [Proteobacteria bacterium]|nr:MBL fold metallo-hydrolase [Pseudomonadota bacterium]
MAEGPQYQIEAGVLQCPEPGLRLVLAPNPSPMTLHGTNTFLLGKGAVAVIDPGPDDPRHLAAILHALGPGERISHIFVTHAHLDHSALADRLAARTGAPVLAFGDASAGRSPIMAALAAEGGIGGGEGIDAGFHPDILLADGAVTEGEGWQLRAIHTPGHIGNHLSFAADLPGSPVIFSGDHVMGWSTSIVSPPDGDMGAFLQSLDGLGREPAERYYPAHGDPIPDPQARLAELIRHRRAREAQILAALADGPSDAASLARRIYLDTPAMLLPAAARNVLAHLIDLTERNLATSDTPLRTASIFCRTDDAKIL